MHFFLVTLRVKKDIVFLSLKIVSVITNSADPDEMLHYAAFHLGLHYLSKYCLGVSGLQRVNKALGKHE